MNASKIVAYRLLGADAMDKLSTAIETMLLDVDDSGWQLFGPPFCSSGNDSEDSALFQAMVKYANCETVHLTKAKELITKVISQLNQSGPDTIGLDQRDILLDAMKLLDA